MSTLRKLGRAALPGAVMDITRRKRPEEALRVPAIRYRDFFERQGPIAARGIAALDEPTS